MPAGYRNKDEATLNWMENREKVELKGRQLLRRLMNEVLVELDLEFQAAQKKNQLMEFEADDKAVKARFLRVARRELKA